MTAVHDLGHQSQKTLHGWLTTWQRHCRKDSTKCEAEKVEARRYLEYYLLKLLMKQNGRLIAICTEKSTWLYPKGRQGVTAFLNAMVLTACSGDPGHLGTWRKPWGQLTFTVTLWRHLPALRYWYLHRRWSRMCVQISCRCLSSKALAPNTSHLIMFSLQGKGSSYLVRQTLRKSVF